MKKQSLIISIIVVIVSIFVSCSVNSGGENISTTAVTDTNGTTHYYQPVTDDNDNVLTMADKQGVYAEIETNSDGKAVTKKNGTYVTKEHTTVLPIKDTITESSSTAESTAEKLSGATRHNDDTQADNNVKFEPDKPTVLTTAEKPTTNTTETTTQKEIRPAIDKDGWITKWY